MYQLPIVESIPIYLYNQMPINESLTALGFRKNEYGVLQRTFSNSTHRFSVTISDVGIQWIVSISYDSPNKRTIICPSEFGLCEDVTPIEILSILYKNWRGSFYNELVPFELMHGKTYLEYVENLIKSRPLEPNISVDKDIFRLYVKKLKSAYDHEAEDYDIELSCIEGQLKIVAKSMVMFVPALVIENISNQSITLSAQRLFRAMTQRFSRDSIYIAMTNRGLIIGSRIIEARWNGDDLWEYDSYDEFLTDRLMPRSVFFSWV